MVDHNALTKLWRSHNSLLTASGQEHYQTRGTTARRRDDFNALIAVRRPAGNFFIKNSRNPYLPSAALTIHYFCYLGVLFCSVFVKVL
ncbi:hypothetical protein IQ243_26415 [Nostocales cyanobacterium LEGE 11386]|nr:hypothetical protein [Nostocales cyanobacterium LEGE 11386]